MRARCIASYTAKLTLTMGHVAILAPGRSAPNVNTSEISVSVAMGPCGSCHPVICINAVIALKTLWGSPGTELSI